MSTATPNTGSVCSPPSPRATTALYTPSRDTRRALVISTPSEPALTSMTGWDSSGGDSTRNMPSPSQYMTLPNELANSASGAYRSSSKVSVLPTGANPVSSSNTIKASGYTSPTMTANTVATVVCGGKVRGTTSRASMIPAIRSWPLMEISPYGESCCSTLSMRKYPSGTHSTRSPMSTPRRTQISLPYGASRSRGSRGNSDWSCSSTPAVVRFKLANTWAVASYMTSPPRSGICTPSGSLPVWKLVNTRASNTGSWEPRTIGANSVTCADPTVIGELTATA